MQIRIRQAALFLGILLSLSACGSREESTRQEKAAPPAGEALRLGIVPEMNIFEQRKRYQPVLEYLSGKTGLPLKMKIMESYGSVVKGMEDGSIDMAFVGSLDYVIIHDVSGGEVLARPEWKNGRSDYKGVIFTRRDSGITADAASWKGKSMALVHPFTTAGDLFPRAYLKEKGIADMAAHFSDAPYLGSHDAAMRAVFEGRADMGCGKDSIYARLANENPAFAGSMVVLAESAGVPSNGLVVSRKVAAATAGKLKTALLAMHEEGGGKPVLELFGATRFLDTKDGDYREVRNMLELSGRKAEKLYLDYVKEDQR